MESAEDIWNSQALPQTASEITAVNNHECMSAASAQWT